MLKRTRKLFVIKCLYSLYTRNYAKHDNCLSVGMSICEAVKITQYNHVLDPCTSGQIIRKERVPKTPSETIQSGVHRVGVTKLLNFGFDVSVCRLRERGRMSKSVYVRVFNDLELLRYVLRCAIERQL